MPSLKCADINSLTPVLHEAVASLAAGKNKLNIEMIPIFFNQPFVVGVGIILRALSMERMAEKYIDEKTEVILI